MMSTEAASAKPIHISLLRNSGAPGRVRSSGMWVTGYVSFSRCIQRLRRSEFIASIIVVMTARKVAQLPAGPAHASSRAFVYSDVPPAKAGS